MFQNIKTDIIYYNTPADFEMEFNLCGCCRMRLLNDKCADKKTLLTSLSRAVSRSLVIIITASLFDDENIIGTIASSIGSGTEILDNNAYGINSQAEINIIKDSTPLVTDDGIFGGCIIECGPQTMIILTENKSVRKNIMKTLIHPYISDLFALETSAEQPMEETAQNEIIIEPDTEDNLPIEETEEPIMEEPLIEEVEPQEEIDTEQDTGDFIIEDEPVTEKSEYYTEEYQDLYTDTQIKPEIQADDNDGYYYDEEYYIEESKPLPDSSFNTLLLIISIIVLFALAVLCFCVFYVPTKAGVEPSAYLKDVFDTMFK